MSRFRFIPYVGLPILAASALLLTGALGQQRPPIKQSAPPAGFVGKQATPSTYPMPKEDARATATVDKAIGLLNPEKLGWFETTFWQQFDTLGFTFQAHGKYYAGPDHRLRLELKVDLGKTEGHSLIVSDGDTVWNSVGIGKDSPMVSKYSLKTLKIDLNSINTTPQLREGFYKSQSFLGVVPLLQSLRQTMVFTQLDSDRWQKMEVFKLKAEWTPDAAKGLSPPSTPWQPFTPRFAHLFLDKNAPHWPYRVEWWGPVVFNGPEKILMQMEFRNPHIYSPGTDVPSSLVKAFAFDAAGDSQASDRTEQLQTEVRRLRDMASSSGPRSAAPPAKGR